VDASPRKARDVFLAVIKLPAAEREARLREVCGDDQELYQRVSALLQAQAEIGSFHEAPDHTVERPRTESPGTVIGSYKLLEPVGEGGMGTVWMAQQTEPVRRLVALKLIKAGMDSKPVLARFEAERQALALMDHPNIARVLDAGTTDAGRPYFVMDLVKGVPITRYCDEHHLTPRQRLELFLPVCQAIQHAHQKGIIHRDIKPSNVLVALYDGKPVPKVIDFGVAKAAGHSLTDKTLVTGFGAIVGTLEYMSPEQAEVNQIDIDTRSDIYALGVLLYELLAGSPPFTQKELEKAGMLEMLRVIREQEPPVPSTKLSSAEGLPTLAANRGTEPAKLTRLVRGELDWIVMKALEKDRNRRYQTANGFALDVQRYLADEPVLACPPSVLYRFGKFARRHKAALATGAVVALAVLATVVGLAVSYVHIDREKTQKDAALAEAEANLLLARRAVDEMYTEVADQLDLVPYMHPFQRDVLQKALGFYQEFAQRKSGDPAIRLDVAHASCRVLRIKLMLGQRGLDYEQGLQEVIATLQQLAGAIPSEPKRRLPLAAAHGLLGNALAFSGRDQEAEKHYRRALAVYGELAAQRPDVPEHRRRLAGIQNTLGGALRDRPAEAEARHREAIRLCEALISEWPDQRLYQGELANSYFMLGVLWAHGKRFAQAEGALGQAISIFEKASLAQSPYRFLRPQTQYHLARALKAQRRTEAAETAYRQAVAAAEQVVSQFPDIWFYRQSLYAYYVELAALMKQAGRPEEAAPCGRAALELNEKLLTAEVPDDPRARIEAISALRDLTVILRDSGELKGAERACRKLLEVQKKLAAESPADPGDRHGLAQAHLGLGTVLQKAHRGQEAVDQFREGLAIYEQLAAAMPAAADFRYHQARAANYLGIALRQQPAQAGAAARHHRQAIKLCDQLVAEVPDQPRYRRELARGHYALGVAHCVGGRWAEAEASFRQAIVVCGPLGAEVDPPPNRPPILPSVHNDLAWLLATCPDAKVRDPKRAVGLARKAVELDPRAGYWNTLGVAEYRAGNDTEALAALQKAMALTKGGNGFDWFIVAMAHARLDNKDAARAWYAKAVAWMEKEQPGNEELRRFRAEAAAVLGVPDPPPGKAK
jgi:serine/threonine protein kinase